MAIILFGIFIGIFILALGFFLSQKMSASPGDRLFPPKTEKIRKEKQQWKIMPAEMAQKLQNILGLTKDPGKVRELKKRMIMAGCYDERWIVIFSGSKIILPLLFSVVGLPFIMNLKVTTGLRIAFMYLPLAIGFYLPNAILNHAISARQQKITVNLPDALDLLVVCVEAGLGLNSAMKRVADEFAISNPVLCQEFTLLNLEINAGMEREQALRNLSDRTGVEDLSTLCAILIQADRFGTSIATALRVQSDTMRTNRRQKLEELAAKTPVKLVFPLILFIFPALIAVVLGPAVIQLMETMFKD
jgi:tight adherence protein C